jgi:hypothetical protein
MTRALRGLAGLVLATTFLGAPAAHAAAPCLGRAPTIVGTAGNDTLVGTPGRDVVDDEVPTSGHIHGSPHWDAPFQAAYGLGARRSHQHTFHSGSRFSMNAAAPSAASRVMAVFMR